LSNGIKYHTKRFLEILSTVGEIHKYDIIEELKISLSTYEKLKPYIEYKFSHTLSYDKPSKVWKWIPPIVHESSIGEKQ